MEKLKVPDVGFLRNIYAANNCNFLEDMVRGYIVDVNRAIDKLNDEEKEFTELKSTFLLAGIKDLFKDMNVTIVQNKKDADG